VRDFALNRKPSAIMDRAARCKTLGVALERAPHSQLLAANCATRQLLDRVMVATAYRRVALVTALSRVVQQLGAIFQPRAYRALIAR